MKEPDQLRELLLNYKLGRLAQEERERLEERLFIEPEFSAMLEEAEYDLLDDYHAGRLARAANERVEEAFSPAERSHAFTVRASAPTVAEMQVELRRRKAPAFGVLALSLAAVIAIVLATVVLFLGRHTTPQLSADRNEQLTPRQSTTQVRPPVQPVPQDQVAVLLLTPEVLRDSSATPLLLTPNTRTVRVQWILPLQVEGSEFWLAVAQDSGAVRARVKSNHLSTIDGRRVVDFVLSSDAFRGPQTHYLLSIRAASAPPIREYRVTVEGR